MIWLVVAVGLLIAVFGATAGAALITVSRAELTRAVGRRLRGAAPSLAWLAEVDAYLTAASATTSLGVLIVGAALPGLLAGSADAQAGAVPPVFERLARVWHCDERRMDSLAAAITVRAAPRGSNLNPVRLDERLGPRYSPLVDYIRAPRVPMEGPIEAMLLTPVSEEELMLAFSAVVTREGRISRVSVLTNEAHRREIDMILEGISQGRLEPASVGGDPIAVNLVWLLTHTTVRAKAPRTI